MISFELYMVLFFTGGIGYFYFIIKAYKHSKNQGYKPPYPGFSMKEFSEFIRACSKNYKKHGDDRLKTYYFSIHLSMLIAIASMLLFAID